tara:strand:+ start:273 stop:1148 length:876 start_codon:yes stop_codon:yes gene_type:complete
MMRNIFYYIITLTGVISMLNGQELFIQNTDKLKGSVNVMGQTYTTVYDNTVHRYRYFDDLGKEIFLIKSFNEENEEVNLSIEKNVTTESIEIIINNNAIGTVVNSIIYDLNMMEIGRLFGGRYSDKNINDFWEGVDYSRGNISIYDHTGFYKIGSLNFYIEVDYYAVLGLEKVENIDSLDERAIKKLVRSIQKLYKKQMKKYNVRKNPDDAEIKEKAFALTEAYSFIMRDFGIDGKKNKKILGILPSEYLSEERRSNWSDNEGYVPYSKRVIEDHNPDTQIQRDELYSPEE